MTEKQPAPDKKETSVQEDHEEMRLGRLHFFFALLGYILYLVILVVILANIGDGGFGFFGMSLAAVPLGFLMASRLTSAGCPWSPSFAIGLIISTGFWYLMRAAISGVKDNPEPAITILAIFALIIIVLLVIPPKAKPENMTDKDTP